MTAARPDLRVGDAEREVTAGSLREHYAQGRLSTDELNDRLDAAFAATTQGQLTQVTHDLPYLQPAPPTPAPPAPSRRWMAVGAAKAVARFAAFIALLVAAVLVLHITGHDLPHGIIVLVVALFVLRGMFGRRHGHRHEDAHTGPDAVDGHARRAVHSRQHGHGHHHEHHHRHGGHG